MAEQATSVDVPELTDGPEYLPILPRHGIHLFCVAGNGPRFVDAFRRTWRQVPLWARRVLLKHWRKVNAGLGDLAGHMRFPDIELVDFKSNFARGNSGNAVAQTNAAATCFAFLAGCVDAMPLAALDALIAHELAHAVLFIIEPDEHKAGYRYDKFGISWAECDADNLAEGWGFDVDAKRQALAKAG
jgi:hypothetical protein